MFVQARRIMTGVVVMVGSLLMTACQSLQSQMSDYDGEIRSHIKDGEWNAAFNLAMNAEFDCKPHEKPLIASWRNKEVLNLKSSFSKVLSVTVKKARSEYESGDLAAGDLIRETLKDHCYGGNTGAVSGKSDAGLPACLEPCVTLAKQEMLSDRTLARMTATFNELSEETMKVDEKGRKASLRELEAILQKFYAADELKSSVSSFLTALNKGDVPKWSATDKDSYKGCVDRMRDVRKRFVSGFLARRWNIQVYDRKLDYCQVEELTAAEKYADAIRLLAVQEPIFKPRNVSGTADFDDQAERTRVVSGALSQYMVRQLFGSGMSGVQHFRRDGKTLYSVLVVARAQISGDPNVKRNFRMASRLAQVQARTEFINFLKSSISTESKLELCSSSETGDKSDYSEVSVVKAEEEVSNLILVALGRDGDECVVILGWRDPRGGSIAPAQMTTIPGMELTISPTVGDYL